MSLHVGLYTGLSAIRAAQTGIDTVSHNIANSATPGYTRQRVELAAAIPFDSPDGPLGTGVDVTTIARLRDHFADARVRATSTEFARLDVRAELLGSAEDVTGEPDTGISSELNALWDAFEDAGMDPADPAVRRQVLLQLDALASRVRSVAAGWDQLAADTTTRRDAAVDELNGLLGEVAEVNRLVGDQDPLTISNDLLDRRDAALDRIAELSGATVTRQSDATVDVHLGGVALVSGTTVQGLTVGGGDLLAGGTPVTAAASGELAALHEFATTTMPARRAELDAFVDDLVTTLNDQHANGFRADGSAGGPLLATSGSSAATLTVAVSAPDELALAGSVSATTGVPGPLDGTNGQALADLRTVPGAGGSSLNDRLHGMVVDLGAAVAGARRSAQAAGDVAVAAEVTRQSQHGVSIDEEMVDLVRYQRQLEAASRVMTAVDQALDTLVNRVGIVGR